MGNPTITIDLSNPQQFLSEETTTRGVLPTTYSSAIMLPFPESEDQFFGKLLLKDSQSLRGKIMINKSDKVEEDDEDGTVEQVDVINLELDAEFAASLEEQGGLPLSIYNIVYEKSPGEEEEEVDIVVEEAIEVEDEEENVFQYFQLSSEPLDIDPGTRGIAEEEEREMVYTDIIRSDIPTVRDRGLLSKGKKFVIRFFKNGIKKALKKAKKKAVKEIREKGLGKAEEKKALISIIIRELGTSDFSQKLHRENYYISKYNQGFNGSRAFPKINRHEIRDKIDPSQKTLILVPGTFTHSFKKNDRKGSFVAMLKPFGGHRNWFDYLLQNTNYEQIITLDHDSVLHSVEDNIQYMAKELSLEGFRFEQPTAMIATSRGGMLAKYLTLFQHPEFRAKAGLDVDLNLNVEKFVTVASGYCGYMEPPTGEKLKRGIELLVSFLSFFTGGFGRSFGWILSLSVDILNEMPGLKMQIADSPQSKIIRELSVDGLAALPFANNHTGSNPFKRIIEKTVVDKFLGPNNDFVIGFESQQMHSPGKMLDGFNSVIGDSKHGRGLGVENTRKEIIRFLNHPGISHKV